LHLFFHNTLSLPDTGYGLIVSGQSNWVQVSYEFQIK
jgi:hypothetical protein